ncbi:Glutathione S-transferase [Novosphingobium lubricantis]
MPELALFHFPGACSRVTMTALEMTGAAFADRFVDIMAGEQMSSGYKAINPRGKVPALLVDGELLTENVAILTWLANRFPEAGLLPHAGSDWERAQQLADLVWISATLHPYVRANKMPIRWTVGDEAPVRERGRQLLAPALAQLEAHLEANDWWYDDISIIDVYLYWCYTTAESGQFPLGAFPNIANHRQRIEAFPPFKRALVREAAAFTRRDTASRSTSD